MSSDTFSFRVTAVEGCDVVLEIRPTTAAGFCDLAYTRSFVLMLLRQLGGPVTFEQTLDEAWLRDHLAGYIRSVRVEQIEGLTHESLLRQLGAEWQIPVEHLQPRLTLRATFADEKLAAFFPVGHSDGTTAFDVWWSDPERAALPLERRDPPPFDPQPAAPEEAAAALLALLPRWKQSPWLGLHRESADIRLRVSIEKGFYALRPGFNVRLILEVPAFAQLGGKKRGEAPSPVLLNGILRPRAVPCWFRQYLAEDEGPQPLAYFVGEPALEELSVTHQRLARALGDDEVERLLTREGVIGLFEALLASRPKKELPPDHARLGVGQAPRLPAPQWHWEWRPECLWRRVALHAALGRPEDAQAALAQARARSKKPPKELKTLLAALDAKAAATG